AVAPAKTGGKYHCGIRDVCLAALAREFGEGAQRGRVLRGDGERLDRSGLGLLESAGDAQLLCSARSGRGRAGPCSLRGLRTVLPQKQTRPSNSDDLKR